MRGANTMLNTVFKAPKKTHSILPGLLILVFISNITDRPIHAGEAVSQYNDSCDIHKAPCTKVIQEGAVTLNVNPKPVKAMQELTFTVTLSGAEPSADPYIGLGMPGMHMGPNRVHLKRRANGRYEGKGIIVRCPSGRRTWQATVTIPGAGAAEFIFDVIY
jgi:hypothetical protein